jgi:hypothetical protein
MLGSFRVNWLMIKHLSAQGKLDPRALSLVFGLQTKLELLLMQLTH